MTRGRDRSVGAAKQAGVEPLRGLDDPQPVAVDDARRVPLGIGLSDGVGDRQHRHHRCGPGPDRSDHPMDRGHRDEGPGRVVHQHHVRVVTGVAECGGHRSGPVVTADNDDDARTQQGTGVIEFGRADGHHHPVDTGLEQPADRMLQ